MIAERSMKWSTTLSLCSLTCERETTKKSRDEIFDVNVLLFDHIIIINNKRKVYLEVQLELTI
jgi:hypothetical protein